MESSFKPLNDARHLSLNLSSILRVPDIMRNELLNSLFPLLLQQVFVAHDLELVHEAVYVLDQDVVTGDKDLLLVA